MRIIFAGTPEFARTALAALHDAGLDIALVLTQPDRPAGRGLRLQASPVKQWALEHGLPVAQPRSLRLDGKYPEDAATARAALQAAQADAMVVAAYGLILPQWVLDLPSQGCLNIHASLLPRWRGAAPIHRAIEAGDAQTGVTIMQMDAGLDTGDMLLAQALPIRHNGPDADTTATLHDRLAALGASLIVQALAQASRGELTHTPQPAAGVSYAHKIEKHEAAIDWRAPVAVIERRIRAWNPFPGASTQLLGQDGQPLETIKLFSSYIDSNQPSIDLPQGHILQADSQGVRIVGSDGVLVATELQRAGGKRLAAAAFLRGYPLQAGQRFRAEPAA